MKGIVSRIDLGKYLREFSLISSYLKRHGRIGQFGLDRLFIHGFGDATRRRIEHRLSIVEPDHHPDDPYPMDIVTNAAQFLLSGTYSLTPTLRGAPPVSSTVSGKPAPPNVSNSESQPVNDVSELISVLSTSVATALEEALRNQSNVVIANEPVFSITSSEDDCGILGSPVVDECASIDELVQTEPEEDAPSPTTFSDPEIEEPTVQVVPVQTTTSRCSYGFNPVKSTQSDDYGGLAPVLLRQQTPEYPAEVDLSLALPFAETYPSSDFVSPIPVFFTSKSGIDSGSPANTMNFSVSRSKTSVTIGKRAIQQLLDMMNIDKIDLRPFLRYRFDPTSALRFLSTRSSPQGFRHPLPRITLPQMVQSYRVWNMGIRGAIHASPVPIDYSGICNNVDPQPLPVITQSEQTPDKRIVCYPLYSEYLDGRPRLHLRDRRRNVIPKISKRVRLTYKPRVHRPGRRKQPFVADNLDSYDRTKDRPPDPGVLNDNILFRSELAKIELFESCELEKAVSTRKEHIGTKMVDKPTDDEDVGLDDEETGTSAGSVPTTDEPGPRRSPRLRA
jgi:hypothetical protein